MLELVERRLSEPDRREVLAHMESCAACRELVAHTAQALLDTRPDTPAVTDEDPVIESAPLPLQPGDNVGRFLALHPIGTGGMGVVYAAYDPDLDRRVAIKLLRPDQSHSSDKLRDRLLREAQSLARLNHPAVVTVYDVGLLADQVFVAMEYVDGCTLAEWLYRRRRPWQRILAMLLEAGHGLHAAHQAGLVHRDFKPDNVLVGRDGRVRVTDFGLARPTTVEELVPSDRNPNGTSSPLTATLTQTKTLVGTPTYMAPEQMSGEAVDHRADIFSFCVTAWECLYGERPYSGDTLERLLEQRLQEQVREPPKGTKVPSRIREALSRGLRSDPADRPQALDELLGRLGRDPNRRRRRIVLTLLAVLTAVALLWRPWHGNETKELCRGAATHWRTVWNESQQQFVAEAFHKTDAPFAADMVKAVDRRLASYGQQWQQMHTEACEATHLRGEQSAQLLDDRMQCLATRLARVKALVEVLTRADRQVVRNAVQAVAALPNVYDCAQGAALATHSVASVPAEQRDSLEQHLGRARAQRAAGQYHEAKKVAQKVLEQAKTYGDNAYLAEAGYLLGAITDKLGDIDGAVQLLEKAVATAISCQRDDLAADAMVALVFVVGSRKADVTGGLRWGKLGTALVQRMKDSRRQAELLTQQGIVKREAGRYAEAEQDLSRTLELYQRRTTEHPDLATALVQLAITMRYRGRWKQALERFTKATRIQESTLGEHHPTVAATLAASADLHWRTGDHVKAIKLLQRAKKICVQAYGPEHLETAYVMNHMANVWATSGYPERALELYRKATAAGVKTLGAHHPQVAMASSNVALVLVVLGRYEQALKIIGDVLKDLAASVGKEHHFMAMALIIEADALAGLGHTEQALSRYRRALKIDEQALGKEHRDLSEALTGIAECLLKLGHAQAAHDSVQRARRLLRQTPALFWERGRVEFALARALWLTGERAEARRLVSELVELYQSGGYTQDHLSGHVTLKTMRRWLAEHK